MSSPLHEIGEIHLVVECCILWNDSVLLQRHAADSKYHANLLAFPGGHIDRGENAVEAVIREVMEETGLKLTPESLQLRLLVNNFRQESRWLWSVTAFTAVLSEYIEPIGSAEGDCAWYKIATLDRKLVVPPMLRFFDHMVQKDAPVKYSYGEYLNDVLVSES